MANEWYRWPDTELATAQSALDFINGNENLPLTGTNAATGKPQPDKQKTVRWASEVVMCVDGKVGFPRIPERMLNHLGITAEERQQFLDTFQPTIEEFDPSWIPEEPEE